ncbi:MAG: hypothetical protein ABI728_15105 [Betaproteobacteria bacterium]
MREYLEDYYDMIEVQQRLKAGKKAVPLQKVLAGYLVKNGQRREIYD